MKKYLLIFSLIISFCFNRVTIINSEAIDIIDENITCSNVEKSIVRIVDKYEIFQSNGFVYKKDNEFSYIVTTFDIVSKFNDYKVLYDNGYYQKATLIGFDKDNQIAVLKTNNMGDINPVCLANTNNIYKGQLVYTYGYYNNSNKFVIKGIINQIGNHYAKSGYTNEYRNIVQIKNSNNLNGTGVFDEIGRLIGMITGYNEKIEGSSYKIETNKLVKVTDSIIKYGKYQSNYIKYSLEDYSNLKSMLKNSYGVSSTVSYGVVITTFKPLKYVFGGLNQGMVIVAVNNVQVKNMYELDKQLNRYEKNDNVCLKVIKKNGKTGFYYVKV